eukprot:5142521-Amphidinium_carterae.1
MGSGIGEKSVFGSIDHQVTCGWAPVFGCWIRLAEIDHMCLNMPNPAVPKSWLIETNPQSSSCRVKASRASTLCKEYAMSSLLSRDCDLAWQTKMGCNIKSSAKVFQAAAATQASALFQSLGGRSFAETWAGGPTSVNF